MSIALTVMFMGAAAAVTEPLHVSRIQMLLTVRLLM